MTDLSEVSPSTKRYSDKREAIISAASALFNERGLSGATFSDVAASVGLIKNSITYYFSKKDDLGVACFMRAITVFEGLVASAKAAPDVAGRVCELIRLGVKLQGDILAGTHPAVVFFHEIRALPAPHIDAASRPTPPCSASAGAAARRRDGGMEPRSVERPRPPPAVGAVRRGAAGRSP